MAEDDGSSFGVSARKEWRHGRAAEQQLKIAGDALAFDSETSGSGDKDSLTSLYVTA